MIKIGAVQFSVEPGRVKDNLARAGAGIKRLAERGARLICLPEMFSTGFFYRDLKGLAASAFEETLQTLESLAKETRALVAGSLPEPADGGVYNTFYLVGEKGVIASFRKVHLFRLHGEHEHFLAGDRAVTADTPIGRLGLMVCYDLRFPELARRLALEGAWLVVVPAQWPEARSDHFRVLCRARALENQLFLLAANRSGRDKKMAYCGGSVVVRPYGDVAGEAGRDAEDLLVEVDPGEVERFRGKMDCLADRRPEVYTRAPAREARRVLPQGELKERLADARGRGLKVVFTNGCFDILHLGHVNYLSEAAKLGDILVVGVNSDRSVREIKGEGRPVLPEKERAELVASLKPVDYATLFDEPDPLNLIKELRPDVLVKGEDWPVEGIIGAREVESWGGEVVRIALTEGLSTTKIMERVSSVKKTK